MYSLDTSSLIHGWTEAYPQTTFPALWDRIAELVERDELVASKSVYFEIEDREDRLLEWADDHEVMFLEDDEERQARVRAIFDEWPVEADFTRWLTGADPFVIALAQERGLKVITDELWVHDLEHPRIPDACEHYKVRWTNFLGMIQELGWTF